MCVCVGGGGGNMVSEVRTSQCSAGLEHGHDGHKQYSIQIEEV